MMSELQLPRNAVGTGTAAGATAGTGHLRKDGHPDPGNEERKTPHSF